MSDICPKCGLPNELCVCEDIAREQQKIDITVDKRRYGKMMTIIDGINSNDLDLDVLITKLKKKCASGGTIKDGKIELQGDHRSKVKETLEEMRNESIVVKNKINNLLDTLDKLDKEYLIGNDTLNKRLSGRD